MKKKFRAIVEQEAEKLRWAFVRLPFDPRVEWPERRGMRVKGTVNGFEFRASVFGSVKNGYCLLVTRPMQRHGHAVPGSKATVEIEPDLEERPVIIPPELGKLFKQDRDLKKWYNKLNPSMRKYIADQVGELKSAEARVRRAEQMAEMMMLTMEAEYELPPLLQVAFRRHPLAAEGWAGMTPIQRRSQLLAIFHCQGPEARHKRIEWACAEATRRAQKKLGIVPERRWPESRWEDDFEE
jgi:uncharacterized protein YdeI (YjbR/CyaY-like superfamily)